jgi:hypothetical protein
MHLADRKKKQPAKPAPGQALSASGNPAEEYSLAERVWLGLLGLSFVLLHLVVAKPFHRPLIDLDDRAFVGTLQGVSVYQYFQGWMWRPNALAFPVRDLTFLFDTELSRTVGLQTYLLTTSALFVAYALLFILTIVVMHPANLEIVQWVISRKHLLVGLFLIYAVVRVEAASDNQEPLTPKTWTALFVLNALAIFSHPTGVLFPLWAAASLWKRARATSLIPLLTFLAASAVVSGLWLQHVTEDNGDYRGLVDQTGYAVEGSGEKLVYLVLGLGRATWQLFWPATQAVYFNIESYKNRVGFALFLAMLAALFWLARQAYRSAGMRIEGRLRRGLSHLALAALLFAPEAAFVMRRNDFVIADRFLFLSLPYLLAGICEIAAAARANWSSISLKNSALGGATLAFLYWMPAAAAAPRWQSEKLLYQACVDSEGSDRCYFHHVSKLLEGGCWEVAKQYPQLEAELTSSVSRPHSLYRGEGGLVLSLCTATATGQPPQIREKELDALAGKGATDESLAFARNLLSIEEGKPVDALYRTTTLFLTSGANTTHMSQAMLGCVLGQFEALSALPELQGKGIGPALATMQARYSAVQIAPSAIELGRALTIRSLPKKAGPFTGTE